MFLSDAELRDLTDYARPSKQIEWLRREGFTFKVGRDGHPKVDRQHYLSVMGASNRMARRTTEPDFSGLRV